MKICSLPIFSFIFVITHFSFRPCCTTGLNNDKISFVGFKMIVCVFSRIVMCVYNNPVSLSLSLLFCLQKYLSRFVSIILHTSISSLDVYSTNKQKHKLLQKLSLLSYLVEYITAWSCTFHTCHALTKVIYDL